MPQTGGLVMNTGFAAIVRVTAKVPHTESVSQACTVNAVVPAVVGVPVIWQFTSVPQTVLLRANPVGREPELRLQV